MLSKKELLEEGIKSGKYPSSVYKYCIINDNLIKSISESYIWFSNPYDFNDPFDCKIVIDSEGSIEDFKNFLKRSPQYLINKKSELESKAVELKNDPNRDQRLNDTYKKIIQSLGISCFSYINNNIQMWSYYADKHRGIVLKYNLLDLLSEEMTPFKVRYDENYPHFNYIKEIHINNMIIPTLGTKHKGWSHEEELRIVSKVQGKNIVPKKALREIIFGCNVSKDDKQEVLNLVQSSYNSSNIKISFTEMRIKDFGLDIT